MTRSKRPKGNQQEAPRTHQEPPEALVRQQVKPAGRRRGSFEVKQDQLLNLLLGRLQTVSSAAVPLSPLKRALKFKPFWDSLTDEQRDELLTVDLRSIHIKAAQVSGKSY